MNVYVKLRSPFRSLLASMNSSRFAWWIDLSQSHSMLFSLTAGLSCDETTCRMGKVTRYGVLLPRKVL